MEPYSTPGQPARSFADLRPYVNAYGTRPLNDQTRRPTDIITGTDKQEPVADMTMSRAVARLLEQMGIPVGFNNPYDTNNAYPDYRLMVKRPGKVFAIDHRKTDLCEGTAEEGTYDTTKPVVDPRKVSTMTEMYREVLDA